jgi:hypothetical protein
MRQSGPIRAWTTTRCVPGGTVKSSVQGTVAVTIPVPGWPSAPSTKGLTSLTSVMTRVNV